MLNLKGKKRSFHNRDISRVPEMWRLFFVDAMMEDSMDEKGENFVKPPLLKKASVIPVEKLPESNDKRTLLSNRLSTIGKKSSNTKLENEIRENYSDKIRIKSSNDDEKNLFSEMVTEVVNTTDKSPEAKPPIKPEFKPEKTIVSNKVSIYGSVQPTQILTRFFAWLVDFFVLALTFVILLLLILPNLYLFSKNQPDIISTLADIIISNSDKFQIWLIISILIGFLYHFILHYKLEATVGKLIFHIRLLTKNNIPLSFTQCFYRTLIGTIITILFPGGYLWMLFDDNKESFVDKITNTKIISYE